MLNDITLGQFFPGNSLLHRLDPRMKLILTILFIATIFTASSISSFILLAIVSILLMCISGVSIKIYVKGLKPIIIILAFTTLLNIFLTQGETLLFKWFFIEVYFEGVMYAILMIIRITTLLIGTSALLLYTTSPIAITDGMEQLLAPLKKLHIPVHEFSMMMTIALRFIPTLIRETEKIMNAQKARGTDFTNGNIINRIKAIIPIIIPLFISSFRRAEELATAMECRCYHGGDGRTRMTKLKYSAKDFITLLFFVLFLAAVICLNSYLPIYNI